MPVQSSPAARPIPWSMLAFWGRVVGFLLLFVGTLLVVAGATIWGGCITDPTSCGTSWLSGVLNYIGTGKILWVIGLFALGGGAGLKLHWALQNPAPNRAEDIQYIIAERRANYLVLSICIVLLAVLLFTVNSAPSPFGLPGFP